MAKNRRIAAFVIMLAVLTLASAAFALYGASKMYVKTDNGRSLPVRRAPNKNAEVMGYASYGAEIMVDWSYAGNDGWSMVIWGGAGDGYVQTRYLSNTKPQPFQTPKPGATPTPKPKDDKKAKQKELNKELASEKAVEPFYVAARPSRSSGTVNFRKGPSTITTRLGRLPAGRELLVLAETTGWYRATDQETGKTGYIYKKLTTPLSKPVETKAEEVVSGSQRLGKVTVNGEFELSCRIPEGYRLQMVDMRGDKLVAAVVSENGTAPAMNLSVAYDELYGEVDRMNDMSPEALAVLEETFASDAEVALSYRETGHGTKVLVARQSGDDGDFIDILAIYKGYFIEFTMAPGEDAASQTLTDEDVDLCISFLTDVDFTPVA